MNFKINQIVETINGVARITYIRDQGGEYIFETTAGVFTINEIEAI